VAVSRRDNSRGVRWQAAYRAPDGRERTKTFERKADAERWLRAQETARDTGEWLDPRLGRASVHDVAHRWMAGARPTLKATTVECYESLLRSRVLPTFGAARIAALRPSDVQTWVGTMHNSGLSASRIRKAVVVLRLVLNSAVRDGLILHNAAAGVKLPPIVRREAAFFDPETVETIAREMPEPYDTLVRLLGTLGLRWGEAAALRVRSVDLLHRRLRITESVSEVRGQLVFGTPKTHATRSVPLPSSLARALERLLTADPNAFLFRSPSGQPPRHSNFYNRLWRPTLRRLDLPMVGLHALRHSGAARMISADASDKALQSILGHSSANFTRTVYGHLFDADLDALADRLDSVPRTSRGLRVAGTAERSTDIPSDQGKESGPGWDRTSDRRIMSPLL
jgi:integrase